MFFNTACVRLKKGIQFFSNIHFNSDLYFCIPLIFIIMTFSVLFNNDSTQHMAFNRTLFSNLLFLSRFTLNINVEVIHTTYVMYFIICLYNFLKSFMFALMEMESIKYMVSMSWFAGENLRATIYLMLSFKSNENCSRKADVCNKMNNLISFGHYSVILFGLHQDDIFYD